MVGLCSDGQALFVHPFCKLLFCSIYTMFALSQLMLCLQRDIILTGECVCALGFDEFAGNELCLPTILTTVLSVYLVYFKAFQSSREPHCVCMLYLDCIQVPAPASKPATGLETG